MIEYDIDLLKRHLNSYGIAPGDYLIRELAKLLSEYAREAPTTLVARVGGEEFAMFLPNTTLEDGLQVAERLRQRVADHYFYFRYEHEKRGWVLPITVSAGVVVTTERELSLDDLLQQADAAMRRAKDEGRNRMVAASG